MGKKEIIYLDLFSGIGGFAKGFEDAGLNIVKHYFSEIDKHAIAVYKYNFKNSEYAGDVRTISRRTIAERPNIITFGFPCQDLSVAGKGKGLSGARSGLFFEAIRIIKDFKPEVFIFENVKGLLSSNEGKDFELVLRTIADIGLYECEWQLVNTAWIRPQNRERVFFVGHLRGKSRPEVFPITKNDRLFIPAPGKTTHVFQAITATDYKGLSKQRSNCVAIPVLTPERKEKRQNGRRFKEDGEPMFTLNCQDRHGIFDGHKLRRITPLESERLQGFPDGWTLYGNYDGEIKSISDNQRYKQLGNAVTTDMPRMIAERLSIFGDSQKAGGAFFIPRTRRNVNLKY